MASKNKEATSNSLLTAILVWLDSQESVIWRDQFY
jgi:hypothetical protein